MAIVKELKNLGKKMTGSDLTGNTVSEALKAIEEKYTGGPTYESVFEMEIGNMEESEMGELSPVYAYSKTLDSMPDLPDELYLNSADYPLTKMNETGGAWYLYNVDPKSGAPVRPEEPTYFVLFETASGDDSSVRFSFVSDTPNLSNKTIKLLQKVGGEPSGSDRLVATLKKVPYEKDGKTYYEWQSDKSYTEIKAALDAKKDVEALYPWDADGKLSNPVLVHLYPLFPLDIMGRIGFCSVVGGGDGHGYFHATCLYEEGKDPDTNWEIGWTDVPAKAEFEFNVASSSSTSKTVTPAAGVTFGKVQEAWEAGKDIVFKLKEGSDETKFHMKTYVHSGGNNYFDCTELGYLGQGVYAGIFLKFDSNNEAVMDIRPLESKTS